MFKNLLKIALRNIVKEKMYSAVNILGLSVGITCSLFLLMYILDELSYDRYNVNAENIYRVISDVKEPDNAFLWSVTQGPLAEELRENYPEIRNAVQFRSTNKMLYKNGEKQFLESDFYQADSTVFEMFSYSFIEGDSRTALDEPNCIVLTEKIAIKYFGTPAGALGQSLVNARNVQIKVTGVIKDVPFNSHFRFDALLSHRNRNTDNGAWGGFGVFTYVQLPANYDLNRMRANFEKIVKQKVDPIFEKIGIKIRYDLQRITDIHLHSKIQGEKEAGGDISYIYIFSAVAVFMLVIACINYMNLATARSVNRSKEVGIRKVMGSMRIQLIVQFITESSVMTFLAMVASMVLIYLFLPAFNTLSNKHLEYRYILQPEMFLSLLATVALVGIVGGSYPAFYLSGFSPVAVLKGKLSTRGGTVVFRKVLVVTQFAISIFMLISTLIVYDQLTYLRSKDLGFDKSNVLRIDLTDYSMVDKSPVLMERLKQMPVVKSVASADDSPGDRIGKMIVEVETAEGVLDDRGVDLYAANVEYVKTMGMTIVQGRDFSRDIPADISYSVLVNEAMVSRMAWKDPIGKKFVFRDNGPDGPVIEKKVVGVIKDYHHTSLYNVIEPMMIYLRPLNHFIFVRTSEGDIAKSLTDIKTVWKEVYPNNTFEYAFLDHDLDSQYAADHKRSQLFTAFSGLTIIIACLGLLGLSAFTTEQRTKEIGVRKVIGASVKALVILVSKEFFLLVAIGTVIACPVAWYVTRTWLQNFAYRIELNDEWMTFIISAVLAFAITLLTVGFHVVRAASTNPVKSLRSE
ncbi:MAG: FtsX-like permease family protein [Chryseolinea sp.]